MIIDKSLEMADAQAITATTRSTNVIDLQNALPVGPGTPVYVVIQLDVATDFTTGDETYSFGVETDDNAAFSSAEVLATVAFVGANPAGTRRVFGFTYTNQRYLSILATLAGTTPSCTYSAWLTTDLASAYTAFPKGANS